jgi:hypothetical protein
VRLTGSAVALGAASATAISMVFALLATKVPEVVCHLTLNLVLLPIYFRRSPAPWWDRFVREGLNPLLWTRPASP